MSKIDVYDKEETLIEKVMAYFGWYKVKKVDLDVESLEINYIFTYKQEEKELPKFPVKRPQVKKATTRTAKKG
jgi:hypothetical protein